MARNLNEECFAFRRKMVKKFSDEFNGNCIEIEIAKAMISEYNSESDDKAVIIFLDLEDISKCMKKKYR